MIGVVRPSKRVEAVVDEVLPTLGLAYATDDQGQGWTVTKSMAGTRLEDLQFGQRIVLTVTEHPEYSLASGFAPLD
jgi:hypothetical protein